MNADDSDREGLHNLIIHHWDTDGLCSAAMLLDFHEHEGGTWEQFVPTIGNYFLTKRQLDKLVARRFDRIFIADIAIPSAQLEVLRNGCGKMVIYDHHIQDLFAGAQHNNPIARGEDPAKVPANTWNIMVNLKLPVTLLTVLGVLGDNEERILDNGHVYPIIKEFIDNNGLAFDQLMECVELIDSNFKVGDHRGCIDAVNFLRGHGSSPESIIERDDWRENVDMVDFEIEKWMSAPNEDVGGGVLLKRIDSKCHITSTVGRRTAWQMGQITVIHNKADSGGYGQLYARTPVPGVDITGIIRKAKERGYYAGGKKDVIGVLLPTEELEGFLETLITDLKRSDIRTREEGKE